MIFCGFDRISVGKTLGENQEINLNGCRLFQCLFVNLTQFRREIIRAGLEPEELGRELNAGLSKYNFVIIGQRTEPAFLVCLT